MTERLFYTDSYLREFAASVLEHADGGLRVYLDRTAFYPASGGQPFDLGVLGDSPVVDVVDEGDRIAHVLSAPLSAARVTGRLDWARRFDHMQQHTGQHLLSAVIADLFGHATVSVHFGAESSTLDLDVGALSADRIVEAERRANAVVTENRAVRVLFEDAATAAGLRKAPNRHGSLRIVTIEDLDRSACGGTHVRATGEIGAISVGRVERVKQVARLEFLCGGRAIRRARENHDLLAGLGTLFSATPVELPALVESQRGELKKVIAEARELGDRLAGYRAAELYAGAVPDATGRRMVVEREECGTIDRLRALAHAVARLPRAVFVGAAGSPPTVLLAAADDSGVDAGRVLKAALEKEGGRGGGKPRLAQGTVPDKAAVEAVIRAISG
jgi:alanyl-tRNA synthetase